MGPKAELKDLSVQDDSNNVIPFHSVIQDLSYFKGCIDEGTTPIFFLQYDESSHQRPGNNTSDRVGRGSAAPNSRDKMMTMRSSSFHGGNSKGQPLQQLREFQVQFLLPGGQTLMLLLNEDETIAEIKGKIQAHATKFNLKPMEHYTIKTPSKDGWLSDESVILGGIPFIESCRHNSTTPKLVLGEKGSSLTKKEKLINLEIGSLIGSPLCWTQGDSETNQFRKSMTWVRFQERKRAKTTPTDDGHQIFPWQQNSKSSTGVTASLLSPTRKPSKPPMIKLRLPLLEGTLEKTVIPLGNYSFFVLPFSY